MPLRLFLSSQAVAGDFFCALAELPLLWGIIVVEGRKLLGVDEDLAQVGFYFCLLSGIVFLGI